MQQIWSHSDYQLLSNCSNTKVLSSKEQPQSSAYTKPQLTLGMSPVRKEFTLVI